MNQSFLSTCMNTYKNNKSKKLYDFFFKKKQKINVLFLLNIDEKSFLKNSPC